MTSFRTELLFQLIILFFCVCCNITIIMSMALFENDSALQRNTSSTSSMEADSPYLVHIEDLQYVVFMLYIIVIIVGTIANFVTLAVILFYRRLRMRTFNYLVIYLTVIDMILCSITAPITFQFILIYVRYNSVNLTLCEMMVFLNNLCKVGSLVAMSEMAILRLISLSTSVRARKAFSKTSVSIIVAFSIIPKFGNRYDHATIWTCVVITVVYLLCHLPYIVYGVLVNLHILPVNIVHYGFYFVFNMFSQAGNPIIMFCTASEFRKHVLMFMRHLSRRWCRTRRIVPVGVVH